MAEYPNYETVLKKLSGFVCLLSFCFLVACHKHVPESAEAERPLTSRVSGQSSSGLITVELLTADQSPAPIGRYHDWNLVVTDQALHPIPHASFAITGGMPAHGHGLPSRPVVTRYLGEGRYLVEGMMFTMAGIWDLRIHIMAEGRRDTIDFELLVGY